MEYRETTQTAPLQRFPLPVLQNAPSKSSLALQGLDRALVDAEIILASRTLRIPTEGDKDEGTDLGLSEKMQKRLIELGIEELFAGTRILLSTALSTLSTDLVILSSSYLLIHSSSPNLPSPIPPPLLTFIKSLISTIQLSKRCMCLCAYRKRKDVGLCSSYCRGTHRSFVVSVHIPTDSLSVCVDPLHANHNPPASPRCTTNTRSGLTG